VHEGTWTVTEHSRPAKLVLQIDVGRIQITYRFDDNPRGTTLTRELRYRPPDFAAGADDPEALERACVRSRKRHSNG
jgi:hypothetical protein